MSTHHHHHTTASAFTTGDRVELLRPVVAQVFNFSSTPRKPAPTLVMRERTEDIRLETSYCRSCRYNSYRNIGVRRCVSCKGDK